MRVLVIYCHPDPQSLAAAVRDRALTALAAAGAEVRLADLYAEGFDPVLTAGDLAQYGESPANEGRIAPYAEALRWCEGIVFIYPTWGQGLPAMLKGWLDRVLVPGLGFHPPRHEGGRVRPGLTHVRRLVVLTSHGTSWWIARVTGDAGRTMLMRGFRLLLSPRARSRFVTLHRVHATSAEERAAHLDRVADVVARMFVRQSD